MHKASLCCFVQSYSSFHFLILLAFYHNLSYLFPLFICPLSSSYSFSLFSPSPHSLFLQFLNLVIAWEFTQCLLFKEVNTLISILLFYAQEKSNIKQKQKALKPTFLKACIPTILELQCVLEFRFGGFQKTSIIL